MDDVTSQFGPYERFLRLDALTNAFDVMRARTVYITGWALVLTQCISIVVMTISYQRWIGDHTVALTSIVLILCVMHSLRYIKWFAFYSLSYVVILYGAILATTVGNSFGINTGLLPLLMAGALGVGFISGWRAIPIYFVTSTALIWGLYHISATALPETQIAADFFQNRIYQRAVQASLALLLCSIVGTFLTVFVSQTFQKLEMLLDASKKSNQEKTEFLAKFSDELRAPLKGAYGMTQRLTKSNLQPEEHHYALLAHKCTRRLMQVSTDVLDLSNLDTGQFSLDEKVLDLKALCESVLATFKPLAEKKGLDLTLKFAAHLPEYYIGDERRLGQVLKHLVHNGLKFTDTGSVSVEVGGRLKGADAMQLQISVSDTGKGIAPEHSECVFQRFGQVEQDASQKILDPTNADSKTSAQKSIGTGLGLAISDEIIAFMGGSIMLKSQPGIGSVFGIGLSLTVGQKPTAVQEKQPAARDVRGSKAA